MSRSTAVGANPPVAAVKPQKKRTWRVEVVKRATFEGYMMENHMENVVENVTEI